MLNTVDDTAGSLADLLTEFGALWDIISGPYGFAAQRRPPPSRPLVFTAATAPALRQLLEHGYDTAKLAAIMREFSGMWEIEHVDPGSEWIAVTTQRGSLEMLRGPGSSSARRPV